jgi:hypothetical protein
MEYITPSTHLHMYIKKSPIAIVILSRNLVTSGEPLNKRIALEMLNLTSIGLATIGDFALASVEIVIEPTNTAA